MEKTILNIKIGMVYNDETGEVETDGVKMTLLDSDSNEIDLGNDQEAFNILAKSLMKGLTEEA